MKTLNIIFWLSFSSYWIVLAITTYRSKKYKSHLIIQSHRQGMIDALNISNIRALMDSIQRKASCEAYQKGVNHIMSIRLKHLRRRYCTDYDTAYHKGYMKGYESKGLSIIRRVKNKDYLTSGCFAHKYRNNPNFEVID